MRRGWIGAPIVVLALVLLLVARQDASDRSGRAPTTTSASTTPSRSTSPSRSTTTSSVAPGAAQELLAGLGVRATDPAAPYRRDAFGDGWEYEPETGCSTRERVLIDESVIEPQVDDRCRTALGRWRSVYDGVITTDPADLQIDHLIPLADAWRSGAAGWTAEQRLAFANDRTSPDTLVAVTGSTNQSKGDSTPDEWLPPERSAWCGYAESWVRVKATWHLSVTVPERARLRDLLSAC